MLLPLLGLSHHITSHAQNESRPDHARSFATFAICFAVLAILFCECHCYLRSFAPSPFHSLRKSKNDCLGRLFGIRSKHKLGTIITKNLDWCRAHSSEWIHTFHVNLWTSRQRTFSPCSDPCSIYLKMELSIFLKICSRSTSG